MPEDRKLHRHLDRIFQNFEQLGYRIHNPIGEAYTETRIDCEASISGGKTKNLYILEVIKPIIFYEEAGFQNIVQRAVVIVGGSS